MSILQNSVLNQKEERNFIENALFTQSFQLI
jgi:hypothetical protein